MAKAKKRIPVPDRIVIVGAGGDLGSGWVDAERSVIRTKLMLSGEARERSALITRSAALTLYYELAELLFENAVVFRPRSQR